MPLPGMPAPSAERSGLGMAERPRGSCTARIGWTGRCTRVLYARLSAPR